MKQTRKDFIKKAHSAACSEWKNWIETEFPKLFKDKEFKVCTWYKIQPNSSCTHCALICYQGPEKSSYGIDHGGNWTVAYNPQVFDYKEEEITVATEKEIEDSMVRIAGKKGYDIGTYYKDADSIAISRTLEIKGALKFHLDVNCLTDGHGGFVYCKGFWAKKVEIITKKEAEKKLGKIIKD